MGAPRPSSIPSTPLVLQLMPVNGAPSRQVRKELLSVLLSDEIWTLAKPM